jgi:hypothetical protein
MTMKLRSWLVAGVLLGVAAFPAAAVTVVYVATLSGAAQVPANPVTGSGSATVTWDSVLDTLRVQATFTGLTGAAVAAHIHCCAAPTANAPVVLPFPTFPSATSGSFDATFNAPADALLAGLDAGTAYFNIHTPNFPGGEIRGNLATISAIPEPHAYLMLLGGLAAIGGIARRKLPRA